MNLRLIQTICLALATISLVYGAVQWFLELNHPAQSPAQLTISHRHFSMGSCSNCHKQSPEWHSAGFLKDHGKASLSKDAKCKSCHSQNQCLSCHQTRPASHHSRFSLEHYRIAKHSASACFECHREKIASDCLGCHSTAELATYATTGTESCQQQ